MELVVRPISRSAMASTATESSVSRQASASGTLGGHIENDRFATLDFDSADNEPAQSIKTTAEHPLFVSALGEFVPAGQLQVGELLISSDDQLIEITEVRSTNEFTTVYNLHVAHHHAYFVGGTILGRDVWVHNADYVRVYHGTIANLAKKMSPMSRLIPFNLD